MMETQQSLLNRLEPIVRSVLHREIRSENLFGWSLVGSRATGVSVDGQHYHSDWDFHAVVDGETRPSNIFFKHQNQIVDIVITNKQDFENRLLEPNLVNNSLKFKYVVERYIPFLGSTYLQSIEERSRDLLLDRFVSILPQDKKVQVNVEQIVEWPFVNNLLSSSSYLTHLDAICRNDNQIIQDMIPVYAQALSVRGVSIDEDYNCILLNTETPQVEERPSFSTSFSKRAELFFSGEITAQRIFNSIMYLALKVPEKAYNRFYTFSRFKESGDLLIYDSPTLRQYVVDHKKLRFFRDVIRRRVINTRKTIKHLDLSIINSVESSTLSQ